MEKDSIEIEETGLLLNQGQGILKRRDVASSIYQWLEIGAGVLFGISYVLLLVLYYGDSSSKTCLLGQEGIYDDAPIEYANIKFHRTGFHDPKHDFRTEYEGRPNDANNAAWNRLMRVGIASISAEENAKLQGGSAKSQVNPKEHIVEIEMFHQLHCLKSLRQRLWDYEDGNNREGDATQRQQHFDHCIDYLRQVIMCHGDLTPITFEWNTEIESYLAHHSTVHTCRNFNKIFDWAGKRNTAGMTIDGNHENKNLLVPEMTD